MIVIFAVWFAQLALQRHAALETNAEDLGFHDQVVWNTLQGHPFRMSLYQDMIVHTDINPAMLRRPDSLLAFHVQPLLLPVSLLYRWWPGAETLLVLQAVVAAIGAWPVHRLATRAFGANARWRVNRTQMNSASAVANDADPDNLDDPAVVRLIPSVRRKSAGSKGSLKPHCDLPAAWAGPIFAAVYLLAPPLQWALLSDFHTTVLGATAIAFLYDFAFGDRCGPVVAGGTSRCAAVGSDQGDSMRPRWRSLTAVVRTGDLGFWAAGLSALAAREEVGLIVAPIAAGRLIRGPRRAAGTLLTGVAIAWMAVCALVILPDYGPIAAESGGPSPFLNRYAHLGNSPAGIARTLITEPGRVADLLGRPSVVHSLVGLAAMTGGLWLLALPALAPALPILALNLLSTWPWMAAGQAHYSVLIVPAIAAASCLGGGFAASRLRRARLPGRLIVAGWGLIAALLWTRVDGLTPLNPSYVPPHPTAHDRLIGRFLAQIPAEAAVSASSAVYPHLSARAAMYLYPTVRDAEYILVDVTGSSFPTSPGDQYLRLAALLAEGTFGVIDAADGYLLLGRHLGQPGLPEAFWSFALPPVADTVDSPPNGGLTPRRLTWETVSDGPGRTIRLSSEWVAGTTPPRPEQTIARAHLAGGVRDLAAEAPALWWLLSRPVTPGQPITVAFPPLSLADLRSVEIGSAGSLTRHIALGDRRSGVEDLVGAPWGSPVR